jgi:hypothetical protein
MNILLCYGYDPQTTAVYFERVLRKQHAVYTVGSPGADRQGYPCNEDIYALVERGAIPKPELVLYIDAGPRFFPRGFERFDCPTAAYLIDTHAGFLLREYYAYFFDHIFVCHRDYIAPLREHGFQNLHWLPVAADPELHGQIAAERCYDVGFVGSSAASAERRAFLAALERHFRVNDFHRPYPKEQLTSIYSRSKIVFNHATHRDITMRVFESLAAGALLLSNPMANGIEDLLRLGEHYVQYTDEASLLAQVEYYLSHPEERERIAAAGQAAVLARHTYDQRVQTLLDAVAANGGARTARARSMSASELRAAYGRIYSKLCLVDAAFDEFDRAWKSKAGRLEATNALGLTILRRLNSTLALSRRLRAASGRLDQLRRRVRSEHELGK